MSRISSKIIQGAAGNAGGDVGWIATFDPNIANEISYLALGIELDDDEPEATVFSIAVTGNSDQSQISYAEIDCSDPTNMSILREHSIQKTSYQLRAEGFSQGESNNYIYGDRAYIGGFYVHYPPTRQQDMIYALNRTAGTEASKVSFGPSDDTYNYQFASDVDPATGQMYYSFRYDSDSEQRPRTCFGKYKHISGGSLTVPAAKKVYDGLNQEGQSRSIRWLGNDEVLACCTTMTDQAARIDSAGIYVLDATDMSISKGFWAYRANTSTVSTMLAGCEDGQGHAVINITDASQSYRPIIKASLSNGAIQATRRYFYNGQQVQFEQMHLGKDGYIYGSAYHNADPYVIWICMDPSDLSVVSASKITDNSNNDVERSQWSMAHDADKNIYYAVGLHDSNCQKVAVVKIPSGGIGTFSSSEHDFKATEITITETALSGYTMEEVTMTEASQSVNQSVYGSWSIATGTSYTIHENGEEL